MASLADSGASTKKEYKRAVITHSHAPGSCHGCACAGAWLPAPPRSRMPPRSSPLPTQLQLQVQPLQRLLQLAVRSLPAVKVSIDGCKRLLRPAVFKWIYLQVPLCAVGVMICSHDL
eukprot:1158764-Pelagomonas_calceolata.AAC.4